MMMVMMVYKNTNDDDDDGGYDITNDNINNHSMFQRTSISNTS